MKTKVIVIALSIISIYAGSFVLLTNKYLVPYTSGACDVARIVNYDWQKNLYYPAAYIEIKLFGKKPHKPTVQIHSKKIRKYFNKQQKLCLK